MKIIIYKLIKGALFIILNPETSWINSKASYSQGAKGQRHNSELNRFNMCSPSKVGWSSCQSNHSVLQLKNPTGPFHWNLSRSSWIWDTTFLERSLLIVWYHISSLSDFECKKSMSFPYNNTNHSTQSNPSLRLNHCTVCAVTHPIRQRPLTVIYIYIYVVSDFCGKLNCGMCIWIRSAKLVKHTGDAWLVGEHMWLQMKQGHVALEGKATLVGYLAIVSGSMIMS